MTEIDLGDAELDRLVDVLEQNEQAVSRGNGLRWTPDAAAEISEIKEDIKSQR